MTGRRAVASVDTVEAILSGHRVESTIEDRWEIVRRLNARGLSDSDVALQGGMSQRTVERIRKRLNIPAAVPVELPPQTYAPRSPEATRHPGRSKMVDGADRSDGSNTFIDAFFSDPFNRLVAKTKPPCGDRWNIFSPPEKPDHFDYTSQEYANSERRRKREARAICGECPIQAECLDYSMRPGPLGGRPDEFGIWASMTEKDRIKIHKKRRRAAQQLRTTSMSSSSNGVVERHQR